MLRRTVVRAWRIEPAWLLSLGLAATAFSGSWWRIGVPVALDRLLLFAGFALTIARAGGTPDLPPLRWRGTHLLLLAVVAYGVASAFWVGTLDDHTARFALIDRLGVVPFLAFAVAPTAFATPRQREILIRVLVVLGAYLGFTAVAEGVHANALVWPRYILDQSIGIHLGRSRGPFLEAVTNGLALIVCGAAAGVALSHWRDRAARLACWVVIGLCAAGVTLTYTRQIWIGAALGVLAALAIFPALRWRLIPIAALATAAVVLAITLIPGFGADLSTRANDSKPVWSRRTTDAAALRMIGERPVWGWGWATFKEHSSDEFRTIVDIPYRGADQEPHNVVLSRMVDLGIVGGGLWLVATLLALGRPLLRPWPDDREIWRRGYVVVLVGVLLASMLSPLSAPFGTLALWLWAGILWPAAPEPRAARTPAAVRASAAHAPA